MSSTYSTGLQIELPANNEQQGSWGTTMDTNMGTIIEEAIRGVTVVTVTGANVDLTYASPPLQSRPGRNAVLRLTGASTGSRTLFVNATSKVFLVDNQTTGGFDHLLQVTGAPGAAVTIPNGKAMMVYTDGTNFYPGTTYISGFLPTAGGTMTGTLNLAANGLNVGSGQLLVSGGNVSANGNLTVTGTSTLTGNVGVTNGLTVTGTATFNGNTVVGDASADTLTVNATPTFNAATTFSAAANFNGVVNMNGAINLGDAAGDAILVTGTASFAQVTSFSSGAQVPASVATSPTLRCQTSTNTGIYFGGTNTAGFSTNGVARLHCDASGNVGVGTQNPGYTFQVIGPVAQRPGSSVTPLTIGDLVFEATSNTTVTVRLKGSDGTVRSVALTLS